jgi:hypothetical protein
LLCVCTISHAGELTRVVWCAAAADCGARPLGRDGAAAWAERHDGEIAAAATPIFWSRAEYDRFVDGRAALAAELRQRALGADAIADGWRWLGERQRRLVWSAAAVARTATEQALSAAALLAREHETKVLVDADERAAVELRALAALRADVAVEARAEAEWHQAAARALAPAPTAARYRPVEHVWFVRGAPAPARLPNGERGPVAFRDGAVMALAEPPPGAPLLWLDPQAFSDERDALAPSRLQAVIAARLAHGVPAAEARAYLDERLLTTALVRAALLDGADAATRPIVRAQLDGELTRLQQAARHHAGDLRAQASEAAATALLLARLAARDRRDALVRTLEALRTLDEKLAK